MVVRGGCKVQISQKQQMLLGACARQTTGARENARWGCWALLRITRWPLKVALCHNTLVPTTPAAVKCHRSLPSAGQPAAACRRRTIPPPPLFPPCSQGSAPSRAPRYCRFHFTLKWHSAEWNLCLWLCLVRSKCTRTTLNSQLELQRFSHIPSPLLALKPLKSRRLDLLLPIRRLLSLWPAALSIFLLPSSSLDVSSKWLLCSAVAVLRNGLNDDDRKPQTGYTRRLA